MPRKIVKVRVVGWCRGQELLLFCWRWSFARACQYCRKNSLYRLYRIKSRVYVRYTIWNFFLSISLKIPFLNSVKQFSLYLYDRAEVRTGSLTKITRQIDYCWFLICTKQTWGDTVLLASLLYTSMLRSQENILILFQQQIFLALEITNF